MAATRALAERLLISWGSRSLAGRTKALTAHCHGTESLARGLELRLLVQLFCSPVKATECVHCAGDPFRPSLAGHNSHNRFPFPQLCRPGGSISSAPIANPLRVCGIVSFAER
jgi:hypothetical protein